MIPNSNHYIIFFANNYKWNVWILESGLGWGWRKKELILLITEK